MSKDGNQFAHAPRGSDQTGGALSAQIPGCDPEMGVARPRPVWKELMPFRHLILVGAVAGLLLAGFNHNALATNFTNGDFIIYPQADWGDDPNAYPAAELLVANYDTVYASGLFVVGATDNIGFAMVFTGVDALREYLPSAGTPAPLGGDYLNPGSTPSGVFGGEVAALKLNIDFSDAGLLPGNLNVHFGDLVLEGFGRTKSGPSGLNGLTVRQFSAFVNTALGGGAFNQYGSYTIANLDSITQSINGSFFGDVPGQFATDHLAVASVPLVMQSVARSGNSISFTCSTTPASMYQVQCLTNLSQTNWVNLGSAFRATSYTTTISDTLTNAQRFYRVEQLP
jgi:hypothetical protein